MSQIVRQYSLELIHKMKQQYGGKLQAPPQGAIFRAKTPNAVITAYQSGKVLFQGTDPACELQNWPEGEQTERKEKLTHNVISSYTPPSHLFTNSHIGSDEAGTGDYFGPITVSAVYVNKTNLTLLKEIGVKDSKTMTDDKIIKLAKQLMKEKIPYSLFVLSNEKYNRLQSQGWSQGKMKAMLHHHAIKKLKAKIGNEKYTGIVIDQFCTPEVFQSYLRTEGEQLADDTYFMTKAESFSLAVAAGSIIARAKFVKEMNKLSEMAGFTLPKGASDLVDKAIANIIEIKGKDILYQCGKIHFANTKKAKYYL